MFSTLTVGTCSESLTGRTIESSLDHQVEYSPTDLLCEAFGSVRLLYFLYLLNEAASHPILQAGDDCSES